jgi:hypothetical protein
MCTTNNHASTQHPPSLSHVTNQVSSIKSITTYSSIDVTYLASSAPHRYLPPAAQTPRPNRAHLVVPFWRPTSCRARYGRRRRARIPSETARTACGEVVRGDFCPSRERPKVIGLDSPKHYFRTYRYPIPRPGERIRRQSCGGGLLRLASFQSRPWPSRRSEWDAFVGWFLSWLLNLLLMKMMWQRFDLPEQRPIIVSLWYHYL